MAHTEHTSPAAPPVITPLVVQTVSATSPKVSFTMLASGNVLVRVFDTNLAMGWQYVISAANWALLIAMTGAGSYMQFTLQSGGSVAPQAPA